MARKSQSAKLAEKHESFIREFDKIWSAVQDERRQAVQDRRFYSISGGQWENAQGDQFGEEARFEVNKIHQSVIRIFSEYRNNRITVDFRPKDKDSSSETAETLTGLYRADEQESTAQEAYDNAFEEGVGGGMGAWRLRAVMEDEDAEYEDDDDDEDAEPRQRIAIEPVPDADTSVFFDLGAKRKDKADAKRCYLITSYTKDAYLAEFPDGTASSLSTTKPTTIFDWCTPDVVYVAEVFEVETKNETVKVFRSRLTNEEKTVDAEDEADADYMRDLETLEFVHIRDERRKYRKVHKYEMDGQAILKDAGFIAGKCIPVVPYYGKRWFVDNIERFMGQVRLAKDAQRLFNMIVSRFGEIASMTPYEVPILTPEQVAGHELSWGKGNINRSAYRLVNQTYDGQGNPMPAQPIAYVKPPDVPPALAALLQICGASIDELTGNAQEAAGGVNPEMTSISGKAVDLIQKRLDMQTFIYTDNMASAMKRSGQIWLSMRRDITPDEPHDVAIIKPDGTQDFAQMLKPSKDPKTGAAITVNDPSAGNFAVWSDVGPSFSSKRDATVRALMGLMSIAQDPQTVTLLMSVAIMNMDGEGLGDLRDFMRKKLLALGAVKPTDEEKTDLAQAQANTPPDANTVFLQAEAEKSTKLAAKAEADTILSLTRAAQIQEATHATTVDTHLKVIGAANATAVPVPDAAPPAVPA